MHSAQYERAAPRSLVTDAVRLVDTAARARVCLAAADRIAYTFIRGDERASAYFALNIANDQYAGNNVTSALLPSAVSKRFVVQFRDRFRYYRERINESVNSAAKSEPLDW